MKRQIVPIFLCLVLSIFSYSQVGLTGSGSSNTIEAYNPGITSDAFISNDRLIELPSNYAVLTGKKNSFGNASESSISVNVVRWNGSVSSDWFDGANWTGVQGRPLLPPGANDIVEI